jgi:hypothetical protein
MKKTEWNGLEVHYTVEDAGWEGDPSVAGGLNYLGEYVEELVIYSPDGTDITEFFKDDSIDYICDEIMERRR